MDMSMVVIVAALWIVVGLATGLWMVRRGHDLRWVAIAVTLGPFLVPIALERVERRPRLVDAWPDSDSNARSGPQVLVGLDGSPESDQALTTALGLLGAGCGTLVLAEVVGYDATESLDDTAVGDARARLASAAAHVGGQTPVRCEVLAGPAGESLRRFAEEQGMDLLVVGRRGRGMSAKVLGSVSADVVHHSAVPVLVVEPPRARETAPPRRRLDLPRRRGAGPRNRWR